jgi:hypothetical protein
MQHLCHRRNHGVRDFARGILSTDVGGPHFALSQDFFRRLSDAAGRLRLPDRFEQVNRRQQQRQRIGALRTNLLAGAAVKRFIDADAVPEIDARSGADAADHAGAQVAEDVAVQVAHY